MSREYLHHRIQVAPRASRAVGESIIGSRPQIERHCGVLYGVWRNQIGRPRDELNLSTRWDDTAAGEPIVADLLAGNVDVAAFEHWTMTPTLRPLTHGPPVRQGHRRM